MWLGLFVFFGVVRIFCLIVEGFIKFLVVVIVIGVVVNVMLNYFLIIKYGIMGVVIFIIIV